MVGKGMRGVFVFWDRDSLCSYWLFWDSQRQICCCLCLLSTGLILCAATPSHVCYYCMCLCMHACLYKHV